MIIWTPTVLTVLYACVLYFCICTCSAQLSMFHMERSSRNTLIIIIMTVCTTEQYRPTESVHMYTLKSRGINCVYSTCVI